MRLSTCLATALLLALPALAHGGGLNAQGCHNNRKTGEYHCHRSPSVTPPARTTSNQPTNTPRQNFSQSQSGQVRGAFRNCTEARAAGAAPVLRGQPGYGSHLDRDNDGIGCE